MIVRLSSYKPRVKPLRAWCFERRGAIVWLLLAVLISSTVYWPFAAARRQRAIARALRELGAQVYYDYQKDYVYAEDPNEARSMVPTTVLEWLGIDFFHRIIIVSYWKTPVSAAQARQLIDQVSQLQSIDDFELRSLGIGDAIVSELARLKNVRALILTADNITDIGVGHLSKMRNLRDLTLFGAKRLTPDALLQLRELRHLALVRVFGVNISDETIIELKRRFPGLMVNDNSTWR